MAPVHDPQVYKDLLVVLACAAIVVPLVQRLKLSPVLGFLFAGALLGPNALGALAGKWPVLQWVTIGDEKRLAPFAELGVVFLLFLIGLELSLQRLVTMRRLVFGLGGLQVAVSGLLLALAIGLYGGSAQTAVLLGLSLSLSSTAIVLEVLSERERLRTATGRASFAVLLLQDLAVIPLLMLVALFGTGQQGSIWVGLLKAFGQAALAIGLIVVLGSMLLKPLFRLVASSQNTELFVAAALLVAVGSGFAFATAGLSMALGAFVAGLLLAETEFRRAIETALEPFKGLLLGLFFFTVGMSIDVGALVADPLPVLGAILALVALKSAVVFALLRLFGFRNPVAIETAALLAPGGEFAFILIGLAATSGAVSPETAAFALAVTSLSMAMIPLFDKAGRFISAKLQDEEAPDPVLQALPNLEGGARAIVIGHGRVGELVSQMLERHGVHHVVTERSAKLVAESRRAGRPVYFGDGRNTAFLERCGLRKARAVIITIHTWKEIDELVQAVRSMRPDIVIVSRARDADHARHLYELGVTDAVPETIEASLQLSEAALVGLDVPAGPVIASIHEKRDEYRHALQAAAQRAGRTPSRGLRSRKPAAASTPAGPDAALLAPGATTAPAAGETSGPAKAKTP